MTAHTAKHIGIDMAREAYRQWDRQEDPAEVVMRYVRRLSAALQARGLTENDDHLEEVAEAWFRSEAEYLFGADYVVAGQ
jgi:hypothetical protein